jgi:hypothetical protein
MPGVEVRGQYQLRLLSARLREAGREGQGLRRELYKAITKAAKPLAAEIRDPAHLAAYLPNRYAAVLASDLSVTTQKRFGKDPSVAIKAKGRAKKRKVKQLDERGVLTHPVFGDRQVWVEQTSHVKPGFFTDPAQKAMPGIRAEVLSAMHDTTQKIAGH